MSIDVRSSAFQEGESLPQRYTCDGAGISPPLEWNSVPDGTKSIALICEDPDAPSGMFTHWVLFNLPPNITSLPEGVPTSKTLPDGGIQGMNTARKIGYTPPCPPSGTHRYIFKVYALDTELPMDGSFTREELLDAMRGHILDEGQLLSTYSRG